MNTLALGLPGNWEWIIILVVGLLLFGRRLPEVGRSLGRSIVEFKRGVKGIQDEIEAESSHNDSPRPTPQIEAPRDAAGKDVRVGQTTEKVEVEASDTPKTQQT